jgi:hypothetical protein
MGKKVDGLRASEVWCSRLQVAALLGVSEDEVEAMHGHDLHPWQEKDRRWRYRPEEVARVVLARNAADPRSQGKVAAAVFKLFKEGRNLADIVIETEQPTAEVKRLHAEYSALAGSLLVSRESVEALRASLGAPATATGDALATAVTREFERRLARGREEGRAEAEAEDCGEVVDLKTGERRRVPPR